MQMLYAVDFDIVGATEQPADTVYSALFEHAYAWLAWGASGHPDRHKFDEDGESQYVKHGQENQPDMPENLDLLAPAWRHVQHEPAEDLQKSDKNHGDEDCRDQIFNGPVDGRKDCFATEYPCL